MVTPLLVVALCAVGALASAWALVKYVSRRLDQALDVFDQYPDLSEGDEQ